MSGLDDMIEERGHDLDDIQRFAESPEEAAAEADRLQAALDDMAEDSENYEAIAAGLGYSIRILRTFATGGVG